MAEPRSLSIAKVLIPSEKTTLIELFKEYKDVFAWSHEDMQGLDPKFYQHKDQFVHRREIYAAASLSNEPELRGSHKRRN